MTDKIRRSPKDTDRLLLEVLAAANRILEGLADGGELEGLPSGTPVTVPIDDICALSRAVAKAEAGDWMERHLIWLEKAEGGN